jgi:ribosomal protein S18 acetylase RimI-like enzyme
VKALQYSTIRGEPKHKPADGFTVNAFYDTLLKPHIILLTLLAFFGALNRDLPDVLRRIGMGDREAVFHVLLLLLSVIAGLRLFQSLYLAKRDYAHVENDFSDIAAFIAIALFSGGVFGVAGGFFAFILGLSHSQLVVLVIYTFCAFAGTVNFFRLLRYRLPEQGETIDQPVEARIQLVNVLVFGYSTIALAYAAYELYRHGQPTQAAYLAVVSTYLPLAFNMAHSGQLTYLPKFLFKNDPDSPKVRVALFRQHFSRSSAGLSDEEVLRLIGRDVPPRDHRIRTVRATKKEVPEIAEWLASEFGYVFEYIFATTDGAIIRSALTRLLTVAGGLGSFGYMSFYAVTHVLAKHDKVRIGYAKLDGNRTCWIYRFAEKFALLASFAWRFGLFRLPGILRRANQMARLQPEPGRGEIRLTYLFIRPEFRGKGFGAAFLIMLANALLHNITDDLVVDRLTLIVREHNVAARSLFEKAGFLPVTAEGTPLPDPFAENVTIGKAIVMERTGNIAATDD